MAGYISRFQLQEFTFIPNQRTATMDSKRMTLMYCYTETIKTTKLNLFFWHTHHTPPKLNLIKFKLTQWNDCQHLFSNLIQ